MLSKARVMLLAMCALIISVTGCSPVKKDIKYYMGPTAGEYVLFDSLNVILDKSFDEALKLIFQDSSERDDKWVETAVYLHHLLIMTKVKEHLIRESETWLKKRQKSQHFP